MGIGTVKWLVFSTSLTTWWINWRYPQCSGDRSKQKLFCCETISCDPFLKSQSSPAIATQLFLVLSPWFVVGCTCTCQRIRRPLTRSPWKLEHHDFQLVKPSISMVDHVISTFFSEQTLVFQAVSGNFPAETWWICHPQSSGDIVLGVNLCRTLETPNMEGLHCDVTADTLRQLQSEGVAARRWGQGGDKPVVWVGN